MKGLRRIVTLSSIATGAMVLSLLPAHAYGPYHETHYDQKPGQAAVIVVPEPGLDITRVSYGFNGHNLRFKMRLSQASPAPPTGFQQADYIWRFSYGKPAIQAVVEFSAFPHFGVFNPDYIGVTVAGSDTTASCGTCFGYVNTVANDVEFYATLDDFNATLDSAAATAGTKSPPPTVAKGTVFHLIEADTQADLALNWVNSGPWDFVADTATAPKGLTFTV